MAGGKTLQQVISIAGQLDPSLQSTINKAQKELDKLTKKQSKGGQLASKAASAVGKAAKATAVAVGAATAAAAAGVVKVTKDALDAYASYEQLTGGVETLFGNSAQTVIKDASEAYKTAGLSANSYMETVTSFSASLLQSLGGDTEKAASYGNMAVIDMADNANKMGSSIEDIQRAYQSMARGQFGMLDNLKLGYGGTKTEMERLIADANKLREANGQAGDLSIDKFSDIVDAIHEVQTNMGITGTTALEASTTIEGSINSAKAAYTNWLTALADDNADIGDMTTKLIESVTTAASNIAPRVMTILSSLSGVIQTQLPTILQGIISALPQLVQIGFQIVSQLAMAIIQALPQLVTAGLQIILMLIQGLISALPQLIPIAAQTITTIIQALTTYAPQILMAGITLVVQLAQGILANLGQIIAAGVQLVVTLGQAIITHLPEIIGQIVTGLGQGLIDGIGGFFGGIGDFFGGLFGGGEAEAEASSTAAGISSAFASVPGEIQGSLAGVGDAASGAFTGIDTAAMTAATGVGTAFTGVGDQVNASLQLIPESATTAFTGIDTAAMTTTTNMQTSFDTAAQTITSTNQMATSQVQAQWSSTAASVQGSVSGISSTIYGIVSAANAATSALQAMASAAASAASAASAATAAKAGGFAKGGFTHGPGIVGEDPNHPTEAVISFNPAYRAQNLRYLNMAAAMLGAHPYLPPGYQYFAQGGFTGDIASLKSAYATEKANFVPTAAVGESISGVDDYRIASNSSGSNVTYDLSGMTFAPQFNIKGNKDKNDLMTLLEQQEDDFIDKLLDALQKREEGVYA